MDKIQHENIKKLVRINLDAAEGYRTAFENVNDNILSEFFNEASRTRKEYAEKLAHTAEIKLEDIGTDLKADLHRIWMDLRTGRQKFDAESILEECKRGEKHAISVYEEILKEGKYPSTLRSSLLFQQDAIKAKYDRLEDLIERYEDIDDLRNRQTPVP